MTLELFEEVMRTNVTASSSAAKAVVPIMKKQGGEDRQYLLPGRTDGPSRRRCQLRRVEAAVISLTKRSREKWGLPHLRERHRACPILTEQTRQYPPRCLPSGMPGGRCKDGLPEDVGDAVIFLGSKRSDWITGVTQISTGAFSFGKRRSLFSR